MIAKAKKRRFSLTNQRPTALTASIAALFLHSLVPTGVRAATNIWAGTQDASWENTNNWSLGAKPGAGDLASFPAMIPGTGSTITLANGEVADSLGFANSYTLAAGTLTLTTGTVNVAGVFVATISTGLTGGGSLAKTGTGTLILGAGNDYTGGTDVDAGTLQVSGGGKITQTSYVTLNFPGGSGALIIDGPGSSVTSLGDTIVAYNGTSTLGIQNGGTLSDTLGRIGYAGGATGAVTVDGAGSAWTNSNDLIVGNDTGSTGTLNIQHGGTVSNRLGFIAYSAGSIGTVTVDGAGSTWTNTNTFNLPLTVAVAGSGTLNIQNGGTVIVNNGTGGALAVVLAQNSGSTGTLNIGNGGSSGTLNASGISGGLGAATLNFNHTDSGYVFALPISGNIAVNQFGSGSTILTGANTFTGATTVSAGELDLNTTGGNAIAGDLTVSGGTARLLQSSQIAAGGNVVVSGGTLAIGGNSNTVAGVRLTAGSITGSGGTLTSATTFDLEAGSVSAILGGAVGASKTTPGTVTLTGANTYTGNTIVNAGALIVDGSIASQTTTINPGASVGGHGAIGGSLINGGIVSPGNSPGTLTVNGNFTQNAGGVLRIEIGGLAAGQHDLLAVGGKAFLGGGLQLVQLNGFQMALGNSVTFLTAAGGVTGTFSVVTSPFGSGTMIGAKLVYGPNDVSLEGVQNTFAALVQGAAAIRLQTQNQMAVAGALDAVLDDSREAKLITHLDSESLDNVLRDLDRIAPEELTSMYQSAIAQARVQTANLARRLEDVRSGANGFSAAGLAMNGTNAGYSGPLGVTGFGFSQGPSGPASPQDKDGKFVFTPAPDNRWGVYVTGAGDWVNVGDTDNARGFNLADAGFTLGIDYKATPHFAIGLALGYSNTSGDLTDGGRVNINGGKAGLYGSYFSGGFFIDGAVFGGCNAYDTARSALLGTARGNAHGGQLDAHFGAGYEWTTGRFRLGPTADFDYSYVDLGRFTESGSLAPLTFPNQNQDSLRGTLGMKASYDWKVGGILIKPELRAGWQHECGDASTLGVNAQFANGAGPVFSVHGPATGRDSLVIGAGFALQWSDRFSTYIYYDAELARINYQEHGVSGGFRWEF